ncbi:hypothetical protein [Aurantiacibacter flavus]|uniref:TonB-dependent receptor-like beta-barrel domain-containing protein n=1 Tax=Aurantiacibacter flavus TaxID=3145232 RepID=A0ABV0CSJ6_9SPHN
MRTNVNLRYRNGFTRIEDTTTSDTIDGKSYDLFADVSYRDNFDLNLNAELDLVRTSYGTVTADMRVTNVLNRIASKEHVSTTYPWQYGRQVWFGLKFSY